MTHARVLKHKEVCMVYIHTVSLDWPRPLQKEWWYSIGGCSLWKARRSKQWIYLAVIYKYDSYSKPLMPGILDKRVCCDRHLSMEVTRIITSRTVVKSARVGMIFPYRMDDEPVQQSKGTPPKAHEGELEAQFKLVLWHVTNTFSPTRQGGGPKTSIRLFKGVSRYLLSTTKRVLRRTTTIY